MTTDWPIAWFRDPGLTEPTPLTVTPDGRVFGHLCEFDRAHIGFGGRRVYAPRDDDMSFFLTGATDVLDDDGNTIEISVGKLTMNTGHASTDDGVSAAVAASHYDHTGSIAALVNAGNDRIGVWLAGAIMPDLDAFTTRRFRSCGASGDWRPIGGQLRLVAALSVPVGGFPIPRARVASGAPLALVAAGALMPTSFGRTVDPTWVADTTADSVAAHAVDPAKVAANTVTAPKPPPVFSPADMAALIADRLHERRRDDEIAAQHAALIAGLDDTPTALAELLAEVDDTPAQVDALLAQVRDNDQDPDPEGEAGDFLSKMPPQLKESWLRGEIAARIRWGTDGDFDRCVTQARKHDVPVAQRKGMCNNLHREALGGKPPGKH